MANFRSSPMFGARSPMLSPILPLNNRMPTNGHVQNGDSSNTNGSHGRLSPNNVSPTFDSAFFGNGAVNRNPPGTVGFANWQNELFRKAARDGFHFNMLVVGRSGLGKSTFVKTLFASDVYDPQAATAKKIINCGGTMAIEETTVELVENGVRLFLTVIDTPGFGDSIDNRDCLAPIAAYIDGKYSEYLADETKVHRASRIKDVRVHCCLYFLPPSGHGLSPLDAECMKTLNGRVNIIPIIAKADTMTPDECADFKKTIMEEIAAHRIKVYSFPSINDDGTPDKHQLEYESRVPFAVCGSTTFVEIRGKPTRVRKYPWGCVEIDNIKHNDFVAIRHMVIRTSMFDLIDSTRFVHYENFRIGRMMDLSEQQKQLDHEYQQREALLDGEWKEKRELINANITKMQQTVEKKRKMLADRRKWLEDQKAELFRDVPVARRFLSASSMNDSASTNSDSKSVKSKSSVNIFRSYK